MCYKLTFFTSLPGVPPVAKAGSVDMMTRQVTVDALTAKLTVLSIGATRTRHVTCLPHPALATLTHTDCGVTHTLHTRRITLA